jgi:serine/threonine protein kinase
MQNRTITPQEYLQAATDGNLDVVNKYITDNIDNHAMLIVEDDQGETALWKAAIGRKVAVVKALIKTGAVFKNVEQMITILRGLNAAVTLWHLYGYRDRLKILELAQRFHCDEIEKNHRSVTLLSDKNRNRLQLFLERLEKTGRLSAESISRAFHLVTDKIPKPEKREIKVTQQDAYAFLWCFFRQEKATIINAESLPPIYYHAKDYYYDKYNNYHNFAVHKGYLDQQNHTTEQPNYLIKYTHRADKEAKCYKLLGQFAFFNERQLVAKWYQGASLYVADKNDIMALPYETRLYLLKMALEQLNTLHKNFRYHGDIKPGNVIIDFINRSIHLIDFETMRKPYYMDYIDHATPSYGSPAAPRNGMTEDMYGFGFVTAALFPEIFNITSYGKKFQVELTAPIISLSIIEKSIVKLQWEMQKNESSVRCTSEQAMEYCNEILKHLNDLNESIMENIANNTICRRGKSITTEDILRGYACRLCKTIIAPT